jgi:hypothetical protein
MDVKIVPEVLVAVFSDGTVMTSVTGTDVPSVMGTKTVALVVGGSKVDVIVYAEVNSIVLVSVTSKMYNQQRWTTENGT